MKSILPAPAQRQCLFCAKSLKGRADQKFCNDYCRNGFHNQHYAADKSFFREINQYLRRNRRILKTWLPDNRHTVAVTKDQL